REDLLADLLASPEGEERVPALRRVPEVEALGDGGIDAPPLEVRPRALALRPPEPVRVEREGELHRAVQRLPLALVPAAAVLREVDAGPAGERPDGLGEREPVLAHQEAERVAADAAAEAVEDALRRIHREGRRLLGVKGAEALPVRAGLAQDDELAHEVDQVDAGADLVEHRAREACHQPTLRAATVAPAPPSCAFPSRKDSTSGWPASRSWTVLRSAPVPLPWMSRTAGRPARNASSRYFSTMPRASSVVRPSRCNSRAMFVFPGIRTGLGPGAPAAILRRLCTGTRTVIVPAAAARRISDRSAAASCLARVTTSRARPSARASSAAARARWSVASRSLRSIARARVASVRVCASSRERSSPSRAACAERWARARSMSVGSRP